MQDRLVIASVVDNPLYSERQKQTLVSAAMKYLQSAKVSITRDSIQVGAAIVLDAAKRGLKQVGKDFPSAGEGLGKYISAGLKEREQIRQTCSAIFPEVVSVSSLHPDYIGPLGVPVSLVSKVSRDYSKFKTTPNIEPYEEVIKVRGERLESLDNFVEFLILRLPDGVQQRAARMQMDTGDKAKLVRNGIVSAIFRGNVNMMFSVDELWDFTYRFRENQEMFSLSQFDRVKQVFADGGYALSEKDTSYLVGLFLQTRQAFEECGLVDMDSLDRLFQRFNNTLQILHPAKEEDQIITSPRDIVEGRPSLWDRGFVEHIENYVVSGKEILRQAMRQADAKGQSASGEHLRLALQSWGYFQKDQDEYPGKIKNLERQLAVRKRDVSRFHKEFEDYVPRSASDLVHSISILERQVAAARGEVLQFEARIEDSKKRRVRLSKFYREAVGAKQDVVELPRDVYLELLSGRINRLDAASTRLDVKRSQEQASLGQVWEQFDLGYFAKEDARRSLSWANFDSVFLKGQVETTIGLFLELSKNGESHIFQFGNQYKGRLEKAILEEMRSFLAVREYRRAMGFSQPSEQDIARLRQELRLNPLNPKILNIVSRIIVGKMLERYRTIEKISGQFEKTQAESKGLKQWRDYYQSHPQEPLGDDAKKDIVYVRKLWQETIVANVPERGMQRSQHEMTRFASMRLDLLSSILPLVVKANDYQEAIVVVLPDLQERMRETAEAFQVYREGPYGKDRRSIQYMEFNGKAQTAQARLESAYAFLDLIKSKSSLLALNVAKGMNTRRYFELLRRKWVHVNNYLEIPALRQEFKQKEEQLKKLNNELQYRKSLNRVQELVDQLQHLKTWGRPERKHLDRMIRLGFAIPVGGEGSVQDDDS